MEIYNRFTRELIIEIEKANLSEADLSKADLSEADLRKADLSKANLRWANLRKADLRWANLSEADLSEADLSEANLSEAILSLPDLYCLKQMPGITRIFLFKYLTKDKESPLSDNKIKYEVGKTYEVTDYESDERIACGKGLSVATLQWCYQNNNYTNAIFIECEFKVSDIIAIPYCTNGKIRVKKLKVTRELTLEEVKEILDIGKKEKQKS